MMNQMRFKSEYFYAAARREFLTSTSQSALLCGLFNNVKGGQTRDKMREETISWHCGSPLCDIYL